MESYSLLYSSAHRTGLLSGFQTLRSQGRMCDVILESGGVQFPCHRALLASSSRYFWALFGENSAERLAASVSLPALTPEGLDAVLDFLYSGWLSVSSTNLPVVLEAAGYLQVDSAVSICERFMIDGLTSETCCCYANLAERYALRAALDAANGTTATELRTLLQDNKDHLLQLNLESLLVVLDADRIPGVQEVELVELALDWLDENGPLPLLKSNLLLSRLRFGLVGVPDLAELHHSAMATPLIRSQLTRALEYHRVGPEQPLRQTRQSTLRAPERVLLVGGASSADWPEPEMLAFDPGPKKFWSLKSRLPLRLRNPCVCSVGGFLFLIGGEEVEEGDQDTVKTVTSSSSSSNQAWRYDPRFDLWEPVAAMLERRARFSCCVVEGVIYAIGGRHRATLASVEFYDLTTGAWRRAAAMPRPVYGHASTVLHNNIYVSGGRPGNRDGTQEGTRESESSKDTFSWDLQSRTWDQRASMSIARFSHRLATARGFVYALLGADEPFCDIERYDPRANFWTRLRPLLIGSSHYAAVTMPSGNLLLFGGRRWVDGREATVKSVLEYDTERDRWTEVCQLPRPLAGAEGSLLPLPD